MKCKDRYYNVNHHYEITKDEWFEYKDYYLIVWKSQPAIPKVAWRVNLQPKHRHHRSVKIRNIRKIYGFTVADLVWKVRFCEYNNRSHGVAVEQSHKHRLYVCFY